VGIEGDGGQYVLKVKIYLKKVNKIICFGHN
jgi:hypothetical protein